jgi:hypothetical protein
VPDVLHKTKKVVLQRLERLAAPAGEDGPRIFLPNKDGDEPPPPVAEQLAAGRRVILYMPEHPDGPDREGLG